MLLKVPWSLKQTMMRVSGFWPRTMRSDFASLRDTCFNQRSANIVVSNNEAREIDCLLNAVLVVSAIDRSLIL